MSMPYSTASRIASGSGDSCGFACFGGVVMPRLYPPTARSNSLCSEGRWSPGALRCGSVSPAGQLHIRPWSRLEYRLQAGPDRVAAPDRLNVEGRTIPTRVNAVLRTPAVIVRVSFADSPKITTSTCNRPVYFRGGIAQGAGGFYNDGPQWCVVCGSRKGRLAPRLLIALLRERLTIRTPLEGRGNP